MDYKINKNKYKQISWSMEQVQNLLDMVPASHADTRIHSFLQFKDWINNSFTPNTDLNPPSQISKKGSIKPLKLRAAQSFSEPHHVATTLSKKLSIGYNDLTQIREKKEPEHSMVSSYLTKSKRKASFAGGGQLGGQLGFDLRQNSMMGSRSAQSSVSVNGFEQINQYQLTKLLGKGSFADVFMGVDTESEDGKKYAIKVLCRKKIKKRLLLKKNSQMLDKPPTPSSEEQAPTQPQSLAEIFVRNEVAILKKIDHQYITKLHDLIVDNEKDKVYLVLDYCEGGFINEDKEEKGRYKKLLESQCRRYCRQLGQALDYIHNLAQIAHRDIKPQNILLNNHDEVKLSDFGLGTHKLKGRQSAGTPLFIPPQSLTNKDINKPAGDIWALGVTLLVLLTAKHPEFKQQKIDPVAEMAKLKDISENCRDFIGRCLDLNPETRIKASELLQHKWLWMENDSLRLSMPNKSITVTEEEVVNVISDRQDKKGGDSPTVFKIAVI